MVIAALRKDRASARIFLSDPAGSNRAVRFSRMAQEMRADENKNQAKTGRLAANHMSQRKALSLQQTTRVDRGLITNGTLTVQTNISLLAVAAVVLVLFPSLGNAGTWLPFGPKTYTRGTGAPVTVADTFMVLNPATQYKLKAFNGGLQDNQNELVSGSVVILNGVQVIGPNNFKQGVAEVDVAILPQVTNALSVQLRGQPGGVLAIEIVGVDNDPPTITASVSPSPNAAGWNNSPVTVTFTCSDKTSGVASCPAPVTVSTEGAKQVVSGTATDLAGNTATTSVIVNLDMTPPTITGAPSPPPDAGGYNSTAVTVTFTCSDVLSGVASCPSAASVASEGTTQVPGTATDVAGNTASITVTVNISFNNFKIRTWQTGPNGNAAFPHGMCLDYGTSPSGNGASVFLNDCDKANSIRVKEINRMIGGAQSYEVMLFAGNKVIGIHNPPLPPTNMAGASPLTSSTAMASQAATEYPLELQFPFTSIIGSRISSSANQIFRLDGDGIILELNTPNPTPSPVPDSGPCINTFVTNPPFCPDPPRQLVIQVQNARGAIGSPLVADVRNLADDEFWDFVATDGSGKFPTSGFVTMVGSPGPTGSAPTQINSNWQLWNAVCGSPQVQPRTDSALIYDPGQTDDNTALTGCASYQIPQALQNPLFPQSPLGWGSVIVIAGDDPNECTSYSGVGSCLDLSGYPPITLPAGVTIRGNRRGTSFGPQLFANYKDRSVVFLVEGDYARVTGLRLRGQSRSTDTLPFKTNAIWIDYVGKETAPGGTPPQIPLFPLATVTELIATIDHNDMSDWMDAAVTVDSPFNVSASNSTKCTYNGYVDTNSNPQNFYTCDPSTMQSVPYSPSLVSLNPNLNAVPVATDAGTLANIRVARNFLHHNERNGGGYGVGMNNAGGRLLIDGNTFSWNRHDITGSGEPHSEYRASNNLVLSGAPTYSNPFLGRLQDFDMHGTDNIDFCVIPLLKVGCIGLYFGGAGGYYVEIADNTFLGGDGHDYALRGFPILNTSYHDNVSRRKENDAVKFIHCNPINTSGCINDYTNSPFPIDISNSQFGQSTPDPTSTLGVGDFDGDGDDDLFLATGAGWYYSPGGQREWRFLNSAHDTIDQLLLGDFDGDGRTDVVALRNGQLVISWGGISAFEVLNANSLPCASVSDMVVGDFDGDGHPDIFCADQTNWWVAFGGNTAFVQVGSSSFHGQDLGFGDFNRDGTTDVFGVTSYSGRNYWQVSYSPKGMPGTSFSGWTPLQPTLTNPTNGQPVTTANGLVIADFNGDGIADVGIWCGNGGILGVGAYSGWQISYGGNQGWSACNKFSSSLSLANGAVGHFSGGPGADVLLWNFYNGQGAAPLWDVPGGAGTPYQLSSQDMH
jgi:hypothetical protein